jgi:hypothetical protein
MCAYVGFVNENSVATPGIINVKNIMGFSTNVAVNENEDECTCMSRVKQQWNYYFFRLFPFSSSHYCINELVKLAVTLYSKILISTSSLASVGTARHLLWQTPRIIF